MQRLIERRVDHPELNPTSYPAATAILGGLGSSPSCGRGQPHRPPRRAARDRVPADRGRPDRTPAGQAGQIVNVASAAAFTPSRTLSAYCTTKAAVLMLSECLRAELAGDGIGVTAICPGIVATNITRTMHLAGAGEEDEARFRARASSAYALRSYGPDGVANAIVKAVRENPAVLTVTPEARVMQEVSRYAPGVMRRLARLTPPG